VAVGTQVADGGGDVLLGASARSGGTGEAVGVAVKPPPQAESAALQISTGSNIRQLLMRNSAQ
jgi:hypothetical protein